MTKLYICILTLLLPLTICCGDSTNRNQDYGGSFYMPPLDISEIVLYDTADPPTLDPARSWGFFDGRVIGLIFSNLVQFDQDANIIPDLALSWEISEDGLIYTFQLNPQATFSTGQSVEASDVKYSYERVMDPSTSAPSQWIFDALDSIEIISIYEIQLKLKEPFAPFIGMLAMPAASIVPKNIVTEIETRNLNFGAQPVGSGPWVLEEWLHDQHIKLIRNDNYWSQKPKTPKLTFKIINNPFTAIAEFETGNLAVIEPIPEAEIERWKTHPNWSKYVFKSQLLNTDMLLFNCSKPPFDNPEFRRALCQAIDTELLLEGIREGAGVVSSGPIPPGISGHNPEQDSYAYDPSLAEEWCRNSDIANKEFVLLLPSTEGFTQTTGEVVQAEWKSIGMNIKLLKMEWVTYRKMLREGDFDIAYRTWFADYPDGDNFLLPLFHSSQIGSNNFARFNSVELDQLINQSQNEVDPVKREQLLRDADDYVFEQAPALFLWHRANYSVHQPWLTDYKVPIIFNGTDYLNERITKTSK